jgi:hypothetical protein
MVIIHLAAVSIGYVIGIITYIIPFIHNINSLFPFCSFLLRILNWHIQKVNTRQNYECPCN